MCGIIAVVRRRTARTIPDHASILGLLDPLADLLAGNDLSSLDARLEQAARALEDANALLRGVPGVEALLQSPDLRAAVARETDDIAFALAAVDAKLDAGAVPEQLERINASLARVKDARWAIAKDRLRTAEAVADLLNGSTGRAAIEAFTSVQIAFERARPVGSARPRLGRSPSARPGSPARLERHRNQRPARPAGGRSPVSVRCGPHAGRHARLRLQGCRGDRRPR